MSSPPRGARAATGARMDRLQPWVAGLSSVALHLLLLLLAASSEPITMSNPEGGAAGGRIEVSYVDPMLDIPPPPKVPPPAPSATRTPVPPKDANRAPAAPRVRTTLVELADEAVAADGDERQAAAAPPAPPRPPDRARPRSWGQPPGMLQQDHAPVNAGPAPAPTMDRGRRYNASSAEPNLEVGGYQVIYDVLSPDRVQAWRDQGMTEVYLPLPGISRLMACPLETVARRGSGPCRLVEPDDPQLAAIGDAREVITLYQVYRRGQLVWRGPGTYR